jgi:hypothetical protein
VNGGIEHSGGVHQNRELASLYMYTPANWALVNTEEQFDQRYTTSLPTLSAWYACCEKKSLHHKAVKNNGTCTPADGSDSATLAKERGGLVIHYDHRNSQVAQLKQPRPTVKQDAFGPWP